MATIAAHVYLTFKGNCLEAMNFYKEALNGELDVMSFRGSPVEKETPEDWLDKVLHSTLRFGETLIMASDTMPHLQYSQGNNFSISVSCTTEEEAEKYFNSLSAGGQVVMPFEDTFWDSKFGMFVDKFGVGWMVSSEHKKD